jgi:iron complex outermembrane receptor protein
MGLAGGATLVHGGVSRRARFPALRELYSGALNRFAPSPDLRPESLVAVEAGVTRRIGRGELQAVVFRHQLNDAVVRITLPDGRFMRVNRDRLLSHGVELLASAPVGRITLGGDLTLQRVRLTDPAAGVTNRPENLPEAFGRVSARFPLALGIRVLAAAAYTGRQYCIDPGTGLDARLDAGAMFSGEIARTWRMNRRGLLSRLETVVAVGNLGNEALFDQCGLPRAGRLLRLQLRLF